MERGRKGCLGSNWERQCLEGGRVKREQRGLVIYLSHQELEKSVMSKAGGQESTELTGVNPGRRSSGVMTTNRIKSIETLEWTTEKARQDNGLWNPLFRGLGARNQAKVTEA